MDKKVIKVVRWIIVIASTIGVIGSLLGLLAGDKQSNIGVLLFWFFIGAIALYFELKSQKH